MSVQNNLAGRKDSLFFSGCREEKRHETGRAGQNFNGGHVGLSVCRSVDYVDVSPTTKTCSAVREEESRNEDIDLLL